MWKMNDITVNDSQLGYNGFSHSLIKFLRGEFLHGHYHGSNFEESSSLPTDQLSCTVFAESGLMEV